MRAKLCLVRPGFETGVLDLSPYPAILCESQKSPAVSALPFLTLSNDGQIFYPSNSFSGDVDENILQTAL